MDDPSVAPGEVISFGPDGIVYRILPDGSRVPEAMTGEDLPPPLATDDSLDDPEDGPPDDGDPWVDDSGS